MGGPTLQTSAAPPYMPLCPSSTPSHIPPIISSLLPPLLLSALLLSLLFTLHHPTPVLLPLGITANFFTKLTPITCLCEYGGEVGALQMLAGCPVQHTQHRAHKQAGGCGAAGRIRWRGRWGRGCGQQHGRAVPSSRVMQKA